LADFWDIGFWKVQREEQANLLLFVTNTTSISIKSYFPAIYINYPKGQASLVYNFFSK